MPPMQRFNALCIARPFLLSTRCSFVILFRTTITDISHNRSHQQLSRLTAMTYEYNAFRTNPMIDGRELRL